jgi:phosphate transport system protein
MSRIVDLPLEELRQLILRMGSLAEAILDKALRAVDAVDPALAREVERDDLAIDELDVDTDQAVLELLARHTPVAEDLRQVFAIKSMATDLERVGDLARNIAKSALRLAANPPSSLPARLGPMEQESRRILRSALDAFARSDAAAARAVIQADDRVDELKDRIVREMIEQIRQHADLASPALDVILIAEGLERVADHATNVAEDVILIAEARNVKHQAKLAQRG